MHLYFTKEKSDLNCFRKRFHSSLRSSLTLILTLRFNDSETQNILMLSRVFFKDFEQLLTLI